MNQNDCLSLPSHFTYLGVCYPGDHAHITLSSPQDPQPANFHTSSVGVPEPGGLALFALGVLFLGLGGRYGWGW